MARFHPNTILGLIAIVFAVVVFFIWVPLDTSTGIVEIKRRKFVVGDGLAPSVAAFFLFVPGVMLVFGPKPDDTPRLSLNDLRFIAAMLAIIGFGLIVMRFAGPLVADLAQVEYRPLRDTAPWKYIGFGLGGAGIIAGIISFIEGRIRRRAILVAVGAVLLMILMFDVPFDDLLLPPNGDV